MQPGILQHMTIEDFGEWKPEVVLVGIGSTEPHGPHLPYGTDFFIADGVGRRAVSLANERGARVLQYPTLPIGCNANYKAFPFACRVKAATLSTILLDLIAALEEEGIRKIVILNSHGGNGPSLQAALRSHFDAHPADPRGGRAFVCITGATTFNDPETRKLFTHSSPHAGESETALVMHLQPDLVRADQFADFPIRKPALKLLAEKESQVHFVRPWHLLLPRSAGGETRGTTEAMGAAAVRSSAAGLAEFLVELSAAPWHPDFPYAPS